MKHQTAISIVIPMYNEVDNVDPFVNEIHDSLKDCVDMQINIEKRTGFAHVNI